MAKMLPALRKVVVTAAGSGLPVPVMAAALSYFDAITQARGTANMIQGQRDYFGAHGYKRTDRDGEDHHSPWPIQHMT